MKNQVKEGTRKDLVVVLGIMMFFLFAKPVWADITKQINDSAGISFYGQVNRGIMYINDGDQTEVHQVDNDNSSSRIGSKIKIEKNGLTAGANLEFEYEAPSSDKIDQDGNDDSKDQLYKRKLEAYLSGNFGKISFGCGSTASDTTSEVDLSGTKLAGQSKVASIGGYVKFFNEDTEKLSDIRVSNAFSNMDGSLNDRVRYDSPVFSGFQLAASLMKKSDDDVVEAAILYKSAFPKTKFQAAIAYVGDQNKDLDQVSGSASVRFPMGLNFTVAAGTQDLEDYDNDPSFIYGKVGYIASIWSAGETTFSLDYGRYSDQAAEHDDGDTMGVQAVQSLKDWNVDLYLGYRFYSLDRDTQNLDDITGILAGMRFKF